MVNVSLHLLLVIVLTVTLACISQAQATEFYKGHAIGIEISKSCQLSDKCVKYSDISSLDNSDPRYFGKIGPDGKRVMSPYTDMYQALAFGGFKVLVDPPSNTKLHMPVITIDTQLPAYFLDSQMKITDVSEPGMYHATKSIRSFSHTRYVNQSCTEAIITADNWQAVLPDTINYMRTGCDPKATKIDVVTNVIKDKVQHNISESYKKKLDNYYDYVKKNCLGSFGKCQPPTDPNLLDEDQVTLLRNNDTNHYTVRLYG